MELDRRNLQYIEPYARLKLEEAQGLHLLRTMEDVQIPFPRIAWMIAYETMIS